MLLLRWRRIWSYFLRENSSKRSNSFEYLERRKVSIAAYEMRLVLVQMSDRKRKEPRRQISFLVQMWQVLNQYNVFLEVFNQKMEKLGVSCFVCGNAECLEDSDHQKITSTEFDRLLKQRAGFHPQIAHLKFKIQSAFHRLEKKAGVSLVNFQADLMLLVDKLHFWDLMRFTNSLKDIEAAIFGFMIPKNQIIRLVQLLNSQADPSIVFPNFHLLLSEVHQFKKNARIIIQGNAYGRLMDSFRKIISESEKAFCLKSYSKHRRQRQEITDGLPLEKEAEGSDYILIEGIPFSTKRQSIDLSMLEIDNRSLMKYLPKLEKIRDLKELYLRNTKLSDKGFQILLRQFPHLQTLDISGHPIKEPIQYLGKLCPKVKTFYINNSLLTDTRLLQICTALPNLRILFADGNEVTDEGLNSFFKQNRSIVFMSFKQNFISEEMGLKIQVNMTFTGGYMEF